MLYDESLRVPPPERPAIGLWRFMIDAQHQRRGIGKAAIALAVAQVRAKQLVTSVVERVKRV